MFLDSGGVNSRVWKGALQGLEIPLPGAESGVRVLLLHINSYSFVWCYYDFFTPPITFLAIFLTKRSLFTNKICTFAPAIRLMRQRCPLSRTESCG